jgi:hypothetical protein
VIGIKMFNSLFKKKQPDFAQELALKEANMALRVRMDQLVRVDAAESFGQAKVTDKFGHRIFEGQAAA